MAETSTIEWTRGDDGSAGATWNPVTGCTKVSAGCDHCYAETFAERWRGVPGHPYEQGFDVRLWPERLELPLRWRKPRRVFVNSMSDLFIGRDQVPDEFVAEVFAVMALAPRHTFQVLTKRPGRMASLLAQREFLIKVGACISRRTAQAPLRTDWLASMDLWPLPNVWLGTSIELNRYAWRADRLRAAPAVCRFLSLEPLLGPLPSLEFAGIDWVIVGGESGPGARPMHPDWARDLHRRARAAGVAFFFKQWGRWRPINHQGEMPSGIGCPVLDRTGAWVKFGPGIDWPGFAGAAERGWQMFHAAGKHAAGRELDGRTWDEFPKRPADELAAVVPSGSGGRGA